METEIYRHSKLPTFEERHQILSQAGLILAEARELLQRLEHQERWYIGEIENRSFQLASSRALNSAPSATN